jgi:PAS domain S-box-containing protein
MWKGSDYRWKVSAVLLAAVLVTLSTGLISSISLSRVVHEKDAVVFDYSERMIALQEMGRAFEKKVAQSRAYMISGNPEILPEVNEGRESFLAHFRRLEAMLTTLGGKQQLAEIERLEAEHESQMRDILRARAGHQSAEDIARDFELNLRPKRQAVAGAIEGFLSFERKLLDSMRAQSQLDARLTQGLVLATGIVALLLILAIAWVMQHTIGRLALEERRFLDLVNHLDHSVVWEADAKPLKFNFVSERLQFLLGLPSAEVEANAELFFHHTNPSDREGLRAMIAMAIETRTDQRVDHRMVTVDGREIWVQTGVHVKENSKTGDQLYGLTVDINPTKTVELEVERLRERLDTSLSAARVGVFEHDLLSDEVEWSPMEARLFGFDAGVVKLKGEAVFKRIHPEDLPLVRRAYEEATEEHSSFEAEFRVLLPEGRTCWLRGQGKFEFDKSGRATNLRGMNVDVTEQKELEQRLVESQERIDLALAAASIGIWEWDIVTNEQRWSEGMYRIYHLPAGVKLTSELGHSLVHPEDRERSLAAAHTAIQGDASDFEQEFRTVLPDTKEVRWIYLKARIHRNAQNQAVRMIGVAMDVTLDRHASESRNRLIDRLEGEKAMRERFVSMLTHDLRTPLTAAKMSAQLVARRLHDPEALINLSNRMIDNVNRMDKMIQDMLDTSRIKAGSKLSIRPVACELRQLVRATLEDLAVVHGNRLELRAPEEVHGKWDYDGLRRALENLVSNAAKYGRGDTPIEVSLRWSHGLAEISVHNKGNPLTPSEQVQLFDPYARSSSAERSGKIGWGIGLTLVRGIAEAHGGLVKVQSDEGGTTFTICLPPDSSVFVEKNWGRPSFGQAALQA